MYKMFSFFCDNCLDLCHGLWYCVFEKIIYGGAEMKNTKRCPKCSSHDVYRVEAVVGHTYGAGNVIPTGLMGTIKVNRYVCGTCGFCEEWIDQRELPTLRRKFPNA